MELVPIVSPWNWNGTSSKFFEMEHEVICSKQNGKNKLELSSVTRNKCKYKAVKIQDAIQ